MSLCLYLYTSANDSRQASMMEAWTIRSAMMASPLPVIVGMMPRFVCIPVLKVRAASLCMNLASRSSSSSWRSIVPVRNREPQVPTP